MEIRFLSRNPHKIDEASTILKAVGIRVIPVQFKIAELQSDDIEAIVRDKVLRAFHKIGHPIFVEQTGLYLGDLNGFPGGLTQVFWDTLEAERVSRIFGGGAVTAKTRLGYCNGRKVFQFEGVIEGTISPKPRGDRAFQWDCVFVPDGHEQTFAEMGAKKNEISMRRLALNKFSMDLRCSGLV